MHLLTTEFRRCWLAFSLATMVFFPYWMMNFTTLTSAFDATFLNNHYYGELTDNHVDFISAMVLTAILTALFYGLFRLAPKWRGVAASCNALCAFAVLFALNGARIYITPELDFDWLAGMNVFAAYGLVAAAGGAIIVALIRYPAVYWGIAFVFAPVGVVIVANVAAAAVKLAPGGDMLLSYEKPLRAAAPTGPADRPRVLWMIFDELDQRLAFDARPDTVKLPNLDALRDTSFYASRAYPPADNTQYSMASLTTGRLVSHAEPGPADDMLLWYFKSRIRVDPPLRWSRQPNIFKSVARTGVNIAALAHSVHPYCRLFHRWLNACWEKRGWWTGARRTVLSQLARVTTVTLSHIPFMHRLLGLAEKQKFHPVPDVNVYLRFLDAVKRTVRNPSYDFVFVHWSHPHRPFFYDRIKDEFTASNDSPLGYIDQLELVDRTLAEIGATLKTAGLWDRTTIIVSADHHWRKSDLYDGKKDHRVPFIIKLAGQKSRVDYPARLETNHTRRLVEALFAGKIKTPRDIAETIENAGPPPDGRWSLPRRQKTP